MALAFKRKEEETAKIAKKSSHERPDIEEDLEPEEPGGGFAIKMGKTVTPEQIIEFLQREAKERKESELLGIVPWLKKRSDIFKRLKAGWFLLLFLISIKL